MNTLPDILLVDGSSYLYRAFHAMPDLRGPQGEPTGAVHGMVAMLRKLRDQFPAPYMACVFDAKGPGFREAWYPAYKANRPPMPEDLVKQIEMIHQVVRLLGWPVLEVPGIEADDVIGTLAHWGSQQNLQVVISTGDKDMAQLVSSRVRLINTMNNESLDESGVVEKFGVPPKAIVDYLTLMGDAVDNVPGVEKVGPKTAAKWIEMHGSLDAVIACASSIKGKVGENLRAALDWLPQAKRLLTIRCDCDLREHVPGWPQLDALHAQQADVQSLLDFYQQHGFRSWARELAPKAQSRATTPEHHDQVTAHGESPEVVISGEASGIKSNYETILSRQGLEAWLQRIAQADVVALDTETDSLDPMQARLVGISFSVQPGEGAYVPLAHEYPAAPRQLELAETLACLRSWLEDPCAAKVGQNIKYDLHVFANHGIAVKGYQHDTMLQSYVLEAHKPHSLESLAARHLGRSGLSYEDVCGKGAHQISFGQVAIDQATAYASEDSDQTLHVHRVLWPRLDSDEKLKWIYAAVELPTAHVLHRMERHGVWVDVPLLMRQSQDLAQRMVALEQAAHHTAGGPFNLGSPKQIGEILFHRMGIKPVKKTAGGAPSTDEAVLEILAADHPLAAQILEYRGLAKLKSTYTDKLPQMVNARTGRVHTNYAQAVAVTGRLASNEPNLQNIPIRTAQGRQVREAFVAPPGYVMASADYSQIELRIMAHLSEDPVLQGAFEQGLDVHRATAAEVFGVALEQVSAQQRRCAKVINFGLIYGMGAFGLARNLGLDQQAAKNYIERYFMRFSGVKRYMDDIRAWAKDKGYVETVFGRRLYLPEINSPNGPRQKGAERQAINAPMQGTAADLIKLSMIAVQAELDQQGKGTRMVMQVHDELVFEVPEAEVEWVRSEVPRIMASVATLKVPLLAELGFGRNWEEAH